MTTVLSNIPASSEESPIKIDDGKLINSLLKLRPPSSQLNQEGWSDEEIDLESTNAMAFQEPVMNEISQSDVSKMEYSDFSKKFKESTLVDKETMEVQKAAHHE